jgi:hypothetical protein
VSSYSVKHLFPQLLINGYIPIPNRDKVCMLPKWSTIRVDERQCKLWARQSRWPAIGLRIEPPLLVFDLDLPREDIAKAVRAITPATVLAGLERHGNHPKTAFFLRLRAGDEPFHALRTHRYSFEDEPKRTFAVEVFGGGGGGAQVGSFGPHSHDEHGNVLKTYSWVGDRSPANVPIGKLPELTRTKAADFIDAADSLMAAWPGLVKDKQSRKGEVAYEQVYELNDDMVFTDSEGLEYTLEELTEQAKALAKLKQANLRLNGSFTGDPGGNPTRCKVHWSERTGLSITDFKNGRTWRHRKNPDDPEINVGLAGVFATFINLTGKDQ